MDKEYKRCTVCVMDNKADDTIVFDENGQCNYCKRALEKKDSVYFPNEIGKQKLQNLIDMLKTKGQGKEYDCLMGISGGLDSAYLAYLGYKWGLRILAVHIDDGFDTEISKENIKKLVAKTGIKMLTIKPDPEQYNDLTKAFMKASVPDIAIPQDNILFAFLYDVAKEYNINYFLSGGNYALEYILQEGNSHNAMDYVHIKDINKKFGTQPIDKLRFLTTIKKAFNNRIMGIKSLRPLNYIDYNKERAFRELKEFCDFNYYGSKHLENYLTMFVQLYWLPVKFNVDKRTSHLSSMIVSGQITRDQALAELKKPLVEEEKLVHCIDIIKEKLNISDSEFEEIMANPNHDHTDYKTEKLAPLLMRIFLR